MKELLLISGLIVLAGATLLGQQVNSPPQPGAEDVSVLRQRVSDLEERIVLLEQQIQALLAAQGSPALPVAAPGETPADPVPPPEDQPVENTQASAEQLPRYGGTSDSAKLLNPNIGVVGDFIAKAGANSEQPSPSLEMHEVEAGFQAIIDPYARGDIFLAFGGEGVELEEGYITFTSLPGIVARAGKMRSSFGKVNMAHNHTLPWVDRPLVINNLLGGEEGISDAGVSISRIIPAPKGLFLEATGQVFRGDSGEEDSPIFRASRNNDVSAVAHLRGYADISEATNLDLGLSYARGHNELGSDFLTHLYGADATFRWKPLRRSIYHSFMLRSELIWSQRRELAELQRAFGFYASADYQLARRWFVGGRYDWSERSRSAELADRGGSLLLTYSPSEFSRVRGQYRVIRYHDNITANELFVQLIFSLGAHGAHPF